MAVRLLRYFGRRAFDGLRGFRVTRQQPFSEDFCSICQGPYNDPACLPCLHVFCHKCIQDYAEQRDLSIHEYVIRQVLGIIVIPCPLCRFQTYKREDEELRFPAPRECRDCSRLINKVVLFHYCGHSNEDRCLECIENEENNSGVIRCPTCNGVWPLSREELPKMYLCSNCEEFSLHEECIECTNRLLQPSLSPERIRYRGDVWYVDRHGRADNVECEKVLTGYRYQPRKPKSEKFSPKSSTEKKKAGNKQKTESKTGDKKEENLSGKDPAHAEKVRWEPVYQNDCYPTRIWEVTPEGEIHTKKCEKVLLGQRKVLE